MHRDAARPLLARQSVPGLGTCFSVGWLSGATWQPTVTRSVSQPTWASRPEKSKLMSAPATSWPERGALLDPRRTSYISLKVRNVYIPNMKCLYHQGLYAVSVVVKP
jgi:hypothetical protein